MKQYFNRFWKLLTNGKMNWETDIQIDWWKNRQTEKKEAELDKNGVREIQWERDRDRLMERDGVRERESEREG